jgi:hypothetical protein
MSPTFSNTPSTTYFFFFFFFHFFIFFSPLLVHIQQLIHPKQEKFKQTQKKKKTTVMNSQLPLSLKPPPVHHNRHNCRSSTHFRNRSVPSPVMRLPFKSMETTIPHLRTTTTHMKPATKLSLLKES